MQYKDWDGNLLLDPAPRIRNIHIGDTIKIKINDEDRIGRASKYCEYEVIGVYPRNVLTRDKKTGFRRSFSYGDLLTMGLENQDPVCAPGCTGIWTDAGLLYHRMVKE